MEVLKNPPTLKYELLFVWSKRVEPRDPETLTAMFIENEMNFKKVFFYEFFIIFLEFFLVFSKFLKFVVIDWE